MDCPKRLLGCQGLELGEGYLLECDSVDCEATVVDVLKRIGGFLALHLTGSRATEDADEYSNWDFVLVVPGNPSQMASRLVTEISEALPVIHSFIDPLDGESATLYVSFSEDSSWKQIEVRVHTPIGLERDEELRQRRAAGQWRTLIEERETEYAPPAEERDKEPTPIAPGDETLKLFHELWREYPRALIEYNRGKKLCVKKALDRGNDKLRRILLNAGKLSELSELDQFTSKLNTAHTAEDLLSVGREIIEWAKPALVEIKAEKEGLPIELLERLSARWNEALRE